MDKKTISVVEAAKSLANGLGRGVTPEIDVPDSKPENPGKKPADKKPRTRKPKARTEVAEPEAVTAPEPAIPGPVAAEMTTAATTSKESDDSLEGLFLAGEALSGIDVLGGIARADKILTNARAIGIFVDAIGKAEKLAIHELKFGRLESEAKEKWYALSFAEVEAQIQTWAKAGDSTAQGILTVFAQIRKIADMVDAIKPLWQLYCEVVRSAREVRSYKDLADLMRKLKDSRVVEVFFARRKPPEHAIMVGNTAYVPAMERGEKVPMADAGWPFLQEAQRRAAKYIEGRKTRTEELRGSVDNPTPAQVRAGRTGTIWLEVSDSKGAMALVRKTGELMQVRINQAVGLPLNSTGWMSWDTPQDDWPDPGLFHAFHKWKQEST